MEQHFPVSSFTAWGHTWWVRFMFISCLRKVVLQFWFAAFANRNYHLVTSVHDLSVKYHRCVNWHNSFHVFANSLVRLYRKTLANFPRCSTNSFSAKRKEIHFRLVHTGSLTCTTYQPENSLPSTQTHIPFTPRALNYFLRWLRVLNSWEKEKKSSACVCDLYLKLLLRANIKPANSKHSQQTWNVLHVLN